VCHPEPFLRGICSFSLRFQSELSNRKHSRPEQAFERPWLQWLRKNSTLSLFLGGAALQRCDKRFVLIAPLGAEVTLLATEEFFRSLFSRAASEGL
jgi:uncharacterized membrane protein YidH (DUF202 family)